MTATVLLVQWTSTLLKKMGAGLKLLYPTSHTFTSQQRKTLKEKSVPSWARNCPADWLELTWWTEKTLTRCGPCRLHVHVTCVLHMQCAFSHTFCSHFSSIPFIIPTLFFSYTFFLSLCLFFNPFLLHSFQPNHLVGLQGRYLKLRFHSVEDLMKAKRYKQRWMAWQTCIVLLCHCCWCVD